MQPAMMMFSSKYWARRGFSLDSAVPEEHQLLGSLTVSTEQLEVSRVFARVAIVWASPDGHLVCIRTHTSTHPFLSCLLASVLSTFFFSKSKAGELIIACSILCPQNRKWSFWTLRIRVYVNQCPKNPECMGTLKGHLLRRSIRRKN